MLKLLAIVAICSRISLVNCDPNNERILVQYPEDAAADIRKGIAACTVEGEDVPKMIKTIQSGQFTDDASFKRFIACTVRTNGYADSHGNVFVEKIGAWYPDKERTTAILDECNKKSAENAQNPDEIIYETYKCFQQQSPYDVSF